MPPVILYSLFFNPIFLTVFVYLFVVQCLQLIVHPHLHSQPLPAHKSRGTLIQPSHWLIHILVPVSYWLTHSFHPSHWLIHFNHGLLLVNSFFPGLSLVDTILAVQLCLLCFSKRPSFWCNNFLMVLP